MTGPCNRRALLRTSGLALVGLAGCVGELGDDSADPDTPTETTTDSADRITDVEETTTLGEPPAEVAPKSVQSSFFYLTTPDSMDVAAADGTQFVFVAVSPKADGPPSVGDFSLVADDREFWATTTPGPVHGSYGLHEQGRVYDPEDGRAGWLAFEVPDPLDAEEVVVTYDGHEQSLDEEFLAALRAPPAQFELVAFDVPERIGPDESFEVSFAVRNVGESDGTFRACLNESGPSYIPHTAELPILAGERAEWFQTFGSRISAGTEDATYRFRSPIEDRDVTVEVVGESTSTSR